MAQHRRKPILPPQCDTGPDTPAQPEGTGTLVVEADGAPAARRTRPVPRIAPPGLANEAGDARGDPPDGEILQGIGPYPERINPLPPDIAEQQFLHAFAAWDWPHARELQEA